MSTDIIEIYNFTRRIDEIYLDREINITLTIQ